MIKKETEVILNGVSVKLVVEIDGDVVSSWHLCRKDAGYWTNLTLNEIEFIQSKCQEVLDIYLAEINFCKEFNEETQEDCNFVLTLLYEVATVVVLITTVTFVLRLAFNFYSGVY